VGSFDRARPTVDNIEASLNVILFSLRVCYASAENVMSHFTNDFEDLDLKTAISTNVCGYVTGTEVKKDQCLCGLLRVLRVRTPKGGVPPPTRPP
jgi:hypothetical protein